MQGIKATNVPLNPEEFCTCEDGLPLDLPQDYPYVYYCGACGKKVPFVARCWSCAAPVHENDKECANCYAGLTPDSIGRD